MLPNRIIEPLSPPSSPRMSGQDVKLTDTLWHGQHSQQQQQQQQQRPLYNGGIPQSTEGIPYSLPSFAPIDGQQSQSDLGVTQPTPANGQHYISDPGPVKNERQDSGVAPNNLELQGLPSYDSHPDMAGAPAPASPSFQFNHPSPDETGRNEDDADEELDMDAEEDKDDESKPQMTAAELRQHKRKMKRFRLTHNQTRFLMSEFSRQAHPDAAHRERLSREIPGLSPRQVQVWFQNRRAKLKRLTADDRDRIMRSRALPDNFNMAVPMSAPYGVPNSGPTSAVSIAGRSTGIQRPGNTGPLTLDTLRRTGPEHSYVSPTGMASSLGSLAFTPPQSATDTASPISTAGDMSGYGYSQRAMMDSPRRSTLPPGASSAPLYSSQFHQTGRMPVHDRYRRASGDSVASPLRSSMSYGSYHAPGPQAQEPRSAPAQSPESSSQAHREAQREMPPPPGPYGLGFYNDTLSNFQPSSQGQGHHSVPVSPNLQSNQPPYRQNQQIMGSQPNPFPHYFDYQSGAYTSPQLQQYPSFGGSYTAPLPQTAFGQSSSSTQPTLPSQRQHYTQVGPGQDRKEPEADHGDGGAAIPPTY